MIARLFDPTRFQAAHPTIWKVYIRGPWFLLLAASIASAPNIIPTSYWFNFHSLTVADTVEGKPPNILVKRDINRPFYASWVVTVRALSDRDGGATTTAVCTASGAGDYKVTAKVPDNPTLEWWTWPTSCTDKMKPGQYIVTTTWFISLPWLADRKVDIESNHFRVFSKEGAQILGPL